MYRALVIISFLGVNSLIIFGISSAVAYMNTGAERSEMLNTPKQKQTAVFPSIFWKTNNCEGRFMEEQTLQNIEKDYMFAWQIRNNAYRTNTSGGLNGYYTDSAKNEFMRIIKVNADRKIQINGTRLTHNIDVKFYSADGQMVVFEDKNVAQINQFIQDDIMLNTQQQLADYKVMMLLEDGYWRVRHMVTENTEERTGLLRIEGTPEMAEEISKMKGTNYYPQDSPWEMFGDKFDSETIRQDFTFMHKMGLNTIRIFVQFKDFGKEYILEDKLLKLQFVLDVATENHLKVIVTLFDFYGNYDVSDFLPTIKHAKHLVMRFKDHPAIFAWDIKNEPDLDFLSRGKENVLLWLEEMIRQIRKWDPQTPLTIGWSSAMAASNLAEYLDFVSFHDYLEPAQFNTRVLNLREEVPNKPLLLQEYGYPSYSGIWNLFNGSQEKQENYFSQMQSVVAKEELGFIFWTLHDFNSIPNAVVGMKPWHKNRQRKFGILDEKGKPKRAFHLFSEGDSISPIQNKKER